MDKIMYNQIADDRYIGVVTILDYETSVKKCLSDFLISTHNRKERKIVVDLALRVGLNQYRFVAYDISDDGRILWNSSRYIIPDDCIVRYANVFLKIRKDILPNSLLSTAAQNNILNQ